MPYQTPGRIPIAPGQAIPAGAGATSQNQAAQRLSDATGQAPPAGATATQTYLANQGTMPTTLNVVPPHSRPLDMPAPVTAATSGKVGGPGPGTATTAVTPGTPKAPTFAERLAQMFGAGNPFGAQAWYGDNPLETASALANRELGKNIAGIRERYGSSGLGNSDRLALAEGTATGEAATGLADVLAARGQEARNADISRMMQGMLTGEQLAQGRERMPIDAMDSLLRSGGQLGDLQTNEINSPLISMLMSFLTGYSPTTSTGDEWSRVRTT